MNKFYSQRIIEFNPPKYEKFILKNKKKNYFFEYYDKKMIWHCIAIDKDTNEVYGNNNFEQDDFRYELNKENYEKALKRARKIFSIKH